MSKKQVTGAVRRSGISAALVAGLVLAPGAALGSASGFLAVLKARGWAMDSALPICSVPREWQPGWRPFSDFVHRVAPARRKGPGETLRYLSLGYVPKVVGVASLHNPASEASLFAILLPRAFAPGYGAVPAEQVARVSEPPVQSVSEVIRAALPAVKPKGAVRTPLDETVCSLNVVDWELSKVLRALSLQTQANLLLQAPSDTRLTINLTNVPLIDMLRHITAVTNLAFLKVDNTYVIASAERLAKGYPAEWTEAHPTEAPVEVVKPVVMTRVYITNYVKSTQIAETLKLVFEGQGLSVTGGPSQVSPKIESRDTGAVTGITTGVVAATTTSDGLSRVVILRGPEEVVTAAIEVAKSLDFARAQVAINVTIHDITNDAAKELGLTWSFGDVGISEGQGKGLNGGAFTRAPQNFSAAISALEKSDKAKLLASPNVSVLDGEQAFILIGNRVNYPVLIGYTQLNTPIFNKETEKVGIYLQVAPSVSSDNSITLSLYPQVSTITGFLQVNGASYPQIATREAQTTLRVSNGETIVMGGLLRDEEITNMQKVPLLSDIPILGELFKRRKKTKTSSQVLIAITPVVIPPKE